MAKRLWSYRSGDLKECLGFVLLQGVGFIAPVPRYEDIGVDGMVFLHRPNDGLMYPESAFLVQIKSSGVKQIEFGSEAVAHMRRFELPFYIALVDGPEGEVSLHSLNHVFEYLYRNSYRQVVLDQTADALEDAEDLTAPINLPILKWGVKDIFDSKFKAKAHAVLSSYLDVDRTNIVEKELGIFETYNVQTGEPPAAGIRRTAVVTPDYSPTEDLAVLKAVLPRILIHVVRSDASQESKVNTLVDDLKRTLGTADLKLEDAFLPSELPQKIKETIESLQQPPSARQ